MTIQYLGGLSIGAAIPGALAANIAGQAGIEGALPNLQAQLTALASFAPTMGNFTADISLAQSIIVSIQAAIAVGITPPSLSAQIAIIAGIVASIEAQLLAIQANLAIVVSFGGLLATAGLHGYAYSGAANAMGAAVTGQLSGGVPGGGGGSGFINGVIFVTESSAAWTAMGTVFKTS